MNHMPRIPAGSSKILPLDHPEPLAATLGIMLFPGAEESNRRKAAAYASQVAAGAVRLANEDGHHVSYETLLRLTLDAGERPDDLDRRWQRGIWTGDLTNIYFMLAGNQPKLASWESAIKVMVKATAKAKTAGSRSLLRKAKSEFASVAHLWAAWTMRLDEGSAFARFDGDRYVAFQHFLHESEVIRDWGQSWKQSRAKAKPPLPDDVWRVPDDWQRPDGPEWPEYWTRTGFGLSRDMLDELKPTGRAPKKAS